MKKKKLWSWIAAHTSPAAGTYIARAARLDEGKDFSALGLTAFAVRLPSSTAPGADKHPVQNLTDQHLCGTTAADPPAADNNAT